MIKIEDLGVMEYADAWDYQKVVFASVLEGDDDVLGRLLLCEHPHVYTLGRNGQANNLLINDDFLRKIDATYFEIDRGGDITYHGYGQLVGYPILNLSRLAIGLKVYVNSLEQCIINTVKHWGIVGVRLDGAAGVWVETNVGMDEKIAAIGIKSSRFVTMHGFALNVSTDLSYFNHINPCGFTDKGVCSIESLTGVRVDIDEVKGVFAQEFLSVFGGGDIVG